MKNPLHPFKGRSVLNIAIDFILFFLLTAMAGIGFLIKYVLVSGVQRNAIYGSNIDLNFWGMDRHQWGTVHLWISISFLVLILLHILFHWDVILCLLKKMIPNKTFRVSFFLFTPIAGISLFLFAFVVQPEQVFHEHGYRHRSEKISDNIEEPVLENNKDTNFEGAKEFEVSSSKKAVKQQEPVEELEQHHSEVHEFEVNGTQTVEFVAEKYNVPVRIICNELGIPERYSNERLGRLRKRYNFTMSDVSKAISTYKKLN
ncbi:MAG TPA: DUF4405 domain-containing protein [Tenuifilaceae bacterium]|nr:DUF4405 domain-containing protein [Tenuifilaceae bacterium]HPJ45427.1 DUF4405 domain-containing protein [Tenuifilaceae bacterium]HPQ33191.1 DUF4405 domain-containing protein [Tenuifilaceae bacterium]